MEELLHFVTWRGQLAGGREGRAEQSGLASSVSEGPASRSAATGQTWWKGLRPPAAVRQRREGRRGERWRWEEKKREINDGWLVKRCLGAGKRLVYWQFCLRLIGNTETKPTHRPTQAADKQNEETQIMKRLNVVFGRAVNHSAVDRCFHYFLRILFSNTIRKMLASGALTFAS